MCIHRLSPQYTRTSGSPAALRSTSSFNVLAHGAGVGQGGAQGPPGLRALFSRWFQLEQEPSFHPGSHSTAAEKMLLFCCYRIFVRLVSVVPGHASAKNEEEEQRKSGGEQSKVH